MNYIWDRLGIGLGILLTVYFIRSACKTWRQIGEAMAEKTGFRKIFGAIVLTVIVLALDALCVGLDAIWVAEDISRILAG